MSTEADVVIVGAGPVGLTLANILGLQGVRTLVVEERDALIDYPRGVGLDDEALRTFQSIGLVEQILPHTVPNQILRFFDANRRLLVEMAPPLSPRAPFFCVHPIGGEVLCYVHLARHLAADRALYEAKNSGRNRIMVAGA